MEEANTYWCRGLKAFTVLSSVMGSLLWPPLCWIGNGQREEIKDIQTSTVIYLHRDQECWDREREVSKLTSEWEEREMSWVRTEEREGTEGEMPTEPHNKQEKKMVKGNLMRVGCVTQMIPVVFFQEHSMKVWISYQAVFRMFCFVSLNVLLCRRWTKQNTFMWQGESYDLHFTEACIKSCIVVSARLIIYHTHTIMKYYHLYLRTQLKFDPLAALLDGYKTWTTLVDTHLLYDIIAQMLLLKCKPYGLISLTIILQWLLIKLKRKSSPRIKACHVLLPGDFTVPTLLFVFTVNAV